MAAPPPTDVIDWHEAMQQCGDDEEFLRELLADLRTETETQLASILSTIQVRVTLQGFVNCKSQPWRRRPTRAALPRIVWFEGNALCKHWNPWHGSSAVCVPTTTLLCFF